MNDLSASVTAAERSKIHPNMRPRDASSLILVERRAGVPHVLMGRRSQAHVFYPGAFVFPGGRVDRTDGDVPTADGFAGDCEARLLDRMKGRPSARRARACALAAIRETYEETGILLGTTDREVAPPKAADWQGFYAHGVVPELGRLAFIARAITPPRRSRRYDTRFFAADVDAVAVTLPPEERPTQELSELVWVPLEEAKALPIPNITKTILGELEARLDLPGGLAAEAPVPFYYMVRGSFVRELL